MPVLMKEDSTMIVYPVSYSPSAVARAFKIVHSFEIAGVAMAVIYDAATPRAAIIKTKPEEIDGVMRNRAIAILELERKKTIGDIVLSVERFWQDDALQVESVCVEGTQRELGLATLLYETLVNECGVVLMSDHMHYPGGKALWKKIAEQSKSLAIFVLDTDVGAFFPYDGQHLLYNGVSIPEDAIWSLHPDESRRGVILVAKNKDRLAAYAA
ncbi:hypothetical protein [Erwinia aphidicola]|uniref:hypothetical protein n=2 Tax=Erwinia aphidicola TaxID=68334 RepID=UPI0030D351FA